MSRSLYIQFDFTLTTGTAFAILTFMFTNEFQRLRADYYSRVPVPEGRQANVQAHAWSDIVSHLPMLEWCARQCERSIVELGVREAHSTVAFLSGCKGEVHSYDIERSPMVDRLHLMDLPCPWHFKVADTGSPEFVKLLPPEAEMVFFDTLHTNKHLTSELANIVAKYGVGGRGCNSPKFWVFHDTYTCGQFDLSGPDPAEIGIMPAIETFVETNRQFLEIVYQTEVNNGLTIVGRLC